ncbi:glycosyltransferase, partial [Patescibacteria group bacterium]
MQRQKRVVFAGSHAATPAIAVIEEIKRRKLPWSIYWVGKKWASEDKTSISLEYRVLPKMGVTYLPLESGRIQTKFTKHTIPALFKIPFGFVHSLAIFLKVKPELVLSFGGASGAMVVFWSWVFRVPVVIHEQTAV